MPIYEYECKRCGEKFEAMRRFDENDREIKCPKCGAVGPERVLSVFASSADSAERCAPSPSGG